MERVGSRKVFCGASVVGGSNSNSDYLKRWAIVVDKVPNHRTPLCKFRWDNQGGRRD